MFYYTILVNYGGTKGFGLWFETPKDLGDDENSIVDEAIAVGKLDPDDSKYVEMAEACTKEDYLNSTG